MSNAEKSDLVSSSEDDSITRLLFPNEQPRENNGLDELFAEEASVDPLYAPILDAAKQLKRNIEAQTQVKIDTIKQETAEQTKDIYQKLTEAREEYKRLESEGNEKSEKIASLQQIQAQLENDIADQRAIGETQQQKISELENKIETADAAKAKEIDAISQKHEALIEKLKSKIDQINQDYSQQLTNLQQKLTYQQQQLNAEITHLSEENELLNNNISELKENQTTSYDLVREAETLKADLEKSQHTLKEKSEKLLRSDHALKLANEELERSQQYIKELEDKNNTIQKELFENWINKEDEL